MGAATAGASTALLASIDHFLETDLLAQDDASLVKEALLSSVRSQHNGRKRFKVQLKAAVSSTAPPIAPSSFWARSVTGRPIAARQAPTGAPGIEVPGVGPVNDSSVAALTAGHVFTRLPGLLDSRGRGRRLT